MSSTHFWNFIANHYSKQPISDIEAYNEKLEITRKHLKPEFNLLEFGCGTGSTAILHAPYVKNTIAIDASKKMIEIAQKKLSKENIKNIDFQVGDVGSLQAAQYDAILALNVLHLILETDSAVKKFHTLLKPGGYFISSTACIGEMHVMLQHILPIISMTGLIPKLRVMKPVELENLIVQSGFQIISKNVYGSDQDNLFIVAQKL